jgi:transposase
MTVNIVTNEDLQSFKKELISELTTLISARPQIPLKWLKSYQVRELLGISPGTLQNLRLSGKIEYTKINGLTFYKYEDIVEMMEKEKKNGRKK